MCGSDVSVVQLVAVRIGILVFFPIAVALAQGQDTPLLFLGACAFVFLLRSDREFSAGSVLSLTLIRPQIGLALALPFLFARRRVFFGFLVCSSVLVVYSIWLVDVRGAIQLAEVIRATSLGDELLTGSSRMPNLVGFLHRAFDFETRALPAVIGWTTWIFFIATSCACWKALGNRVSILHVGLLILGATALAPHIHVHDAALLANSATACILWRCLEGRPDWDVPASLMVVASLMLTLASIAPASSYDFFLVVALLLLAAPLSGDLRRSRSDPKLRGSR
jgi:hypothetical protein